MTWRLARTGILHAFARRASHSLCGLVRRPETLRGSVAEPTNEWIMCRECRRGVA